ncbi:uncharacterized protein MELLADRAFT_64263 [Melampsora larici-populina 98AG31]|uniref:Uncharacterized protein n=1 Tax=Melampsora larici-populina (strain 98AG31 / pathotype 3-4-7) TaxID=747676 RepID=F4RQT3_MELLP|nr:uncharacterized protein MELLADRAFT_64263 [Melampsora larici-populina 98AG31]EGG05269.1 hypothetical protein MELLADRAFT_64263 [Melampsora larici-populina 98AG31]
MTVVEPEDLTTIFTVDWLSRPCGDVKIDWTYAVHIRSKYPEINLLQAWPKGLNSGVELTIVLDTTPTIGDNESLVDSTPTKDTNRTSNTLMKPISLLPLMGHPSPVLVL